MNRPIGEAWVAPLAVACTYCGKVQQAVWLTFPDQASCVRCHSPVCRTTGKNLDAALAVCVALLVIAVPTINATFLTTRLFGASRTSVLASSSKVLWQEGWAVLAIVVTCTVMIIPWLRVLSLTAVLATIRTSRRPPWLGPLFRWSSSLDAWAMLDICLLGLVVAYGRLHASIDVQIGPGALVLALAALLFMLMRFTLDTPLVWRSIRPDPQADKLEAPPSCAACGWLFASTPPARCPRCAETIEAKLPRGCMASIALLAAAVLLYAPANLYPIATLPIDLKETPYTVLGGAMELARSHLLPLAILVFVASIMIPLLKFAGLSWCLHAARHGSTTHLIGRTRVYRWLRLVGRWSMVDPLTIACFVPVLDYSGMGARADAAALPFAVVVMFTMLAVELFDPRLMWISAESHG